MKKEDKARQLELMKAAAGIMERTTAMCMNICRDEGEALRLGSMIASGLLGSQYKVIYDTQGKEIAKQWLEATLNSTADFLQKVLKKRMRMLIMEVV